MSTDDGYLVVTGDPVTGFKAEVWPPSGASPVSLPAEKVDIACVRCQARFPLPLAVPGDGSYLCPDCAPLPKGPGSLA